MSALTHPGSPADSGQYKEEIKAFDKRRARELTNISESTEETDTTVRLVGGSLLRTAHSGLGLGKISNWTTRLTEWEQASSGTRRDFYHRTSLDDMLLCLGYLTTKQCIAFRS